MGRRGAGHWELTRGGWKRELGFSLLAGLRCQWVTFGGAHSGAQPRPPHARRQTSLWRSNSFIGLQRDRNNRVGQGLGDSQNLL